MAQENKTAGQGAGRESIDGTPVDGFQRQGEKVIGKMVSVVSGKGKMIRNLVIVVVLVAIAGVAVALWMRRSAGEAQAALGKAIQIMSAPIVATPPPDSTDLTYKTEADRTKAAVAAFDAVAKDHGGDVGEKAKYFSAMLKIKKDRKGSIEVLTGLADSSGENGDMAKFALANALVEDGKYAEALALFSKLADSGNGVFSKDIIDFQIASIKEKQGKSGEAVAKYFEIAKRGLDSKDKDGNPKELTATARASKERVEKLNPEKAKEF